MLAFNDGGEASAQDGDRRLLLGQVVVQVVVLAGDALLCMVEHLPDDQPAHAAPRHQRRSRAPQIVKMPFGDRRFGVVGLLAQCRDGEGVELSFRLRPSADRDRLALRCASRREHMRADLSDVGEDQERERRQWNQMRPAGLRPRSQKRPETSIDLPPRKIADFRPALSSREEEPHSLPERAHLPRRFPDCSDLGFGQDALAPVLGADLLEPVEWGFPVVNAPVVLGPLPESAEIGGDAPGVRRGVLRDLADDVIRLGSGDLLQRPGAELRDDVLPDDAVDHVQSAVPAIGVGLAFFDVGFPCLRKGVRTLALGGALGGFISLLRVDPLLDVSLPLAGDLPGLGEAHARIVANSPTRGRCRTRVARHEHEGLVAAIGHADAKAADVSVGLDVALPFRRWLQRLDRAVG